MAAQCVASQVVASQASVAPARQGKLAQQGKCVKAAGLRRAQRVTRRVGGRGVIMAATAPVDPEVVRNPRPEYIPSKIDDPNYVRVFDTTLRDGEQSPGASTSHTPTHARTHT